MPKRTPSIEETVERRIHPGARLRLTAEGGEWIVDDGRPRVRFGRSSANDAVLGDAFASRRHGAVEYRHGRFQLRDESRNGTFVTLGNQTVCVHEDTLPLSGRGSIRLGHVDGSALHFTLEKLTAHGGAWQPGEQEPSLASAHAGEAYVFRCEGEYWTLGYADAVLRLKDAKGLHYIAQLLRHPGREFHVLDLAATAAPGPGTDEGPAPARAHLRRAAAGSAGPVLDAQAKAAYRRRLEALRAELEEAERNRDLGHAARAREEIDAVTGQLMEAVGLGGRDREAASNAERARVTITTRVRTSLEKIRRGHPGLGHHLGASVKTGRYCSYQPDPTRPIDWVL
jgi:predicted component of type VI protein secretion system